MTSILPILTGFLLGAGYLHITKRKTHTKPADKPASRVVVTLSGTVTAHRDVCQRPGCILELSNGKTTGYYHIPLSIKAAQKEHPVGQTASVKVFQDAIPIDGIYEALPS